MKLLMNARMNQHASSNHYKVGRLFVEPWHQIEAGYALGYHIGIGTCLKLWGLLDILVYK